MKRKRKVMFWEGNEVLAVRPKKIAYTLADMPPEIRAALRDLLVHGATLQTATNILNQREDCGATMEAVQEFSFSDPQLPTDRTKYLVDTTERIAAALGGADTGEARFVKAVIMSGLVHFDESDDSLTVNQALLHKKEVENLAQKNRVLKMKMSVSIEDKRIRRETVKMIIARREFVMAQTSKLRDLVRKLEKKRSITPETLQKIQEVYGILAENVSRASAEIEIPGFLPSPASDSPQDDPDLQPEVYLTDPALRDPQAEVEKAVWERFRQLNAAPEEDNPQITQIAQIEPSESGESAESMDSPAIESGKSAESAKSVDSRAKIS